MKWDVFFGRNRQAADRDREEIRGLIGRIEKTAPRGFRPDRSSRYYHYEQIRAYGKPLLALLRALSDRDRLSADEGEAVRALFLVLRDFYDVRGRLGLSEAVLDPRLRRKFVHLLLIFYGRKDITGERLAAHLDPLRDVPV